MTPADRRKKAHSDLDHAIAAMEDHYKTRRELTFYRVTRQITDHRVDSALWTARAALQHLHSEGILGKRTIISGYNGQLRRLAPVILDMILDAEEEQQNG